MKNGYIIKIVPPWGYRVFRVEFTPRHLAFALSLSALSFLGVGSYYVFSLEHAAVKVDQLRNLTDDQRERLKRIDAQASELDQNLRALQKQNDQIRKLIGADGKNGAKTVEKVRAERTGDDRQTMRATGDFATVAGRVEQLHNDSLRLRGEGASLRGLALHVLNMRRLEDIARARLLAAIPSINPTANAGIASAFGWRVNPWPEFHKGVDLDANYGDVVRSSAAGTVVSAGWDGGYGIKVDVDHGNGYHTWYCHLSKAEVTPGQYVRKTQEIALVGSTGASTGPHLHYQIMLDGNAVDPTPYLNGVPAKVLASLK